MGIRFEEAPAGEVAPKQKRGIMDDAPRLGNVYGFTLEQLAIKPGWNSREVIFDPADPDDLWLAKDIKAQGVLEPLTVVKEGEAVYITNGHRRHAAATYAQNELGAKVERLPCRLEPRGSNPLDHLFSQRSRNGGKQFSPFENGALCKKALALGATLDEVADRMRVGKGYILSLLDLQAAPSAVTDLVRSDAVAPTLAMQVIREAKGDTSVATERLYGAIAKAKAEGKTRATAKHVDRPPPDLRKSVGYAAAMKRAVEIAEGFLRSRDDDGEAGEIFVARQIVDALSIEMGSLK